MTPTRTMGGTRQARIKALFRVVHAHTGYDQWSITGPRRVHDLIIVRQSAIHLAITQLPDLSLSHIARIFGRDHTTIMHARDMVKSEMAVGHGPRLTLIASLAPYLEEAIADIMAGRSCRVARVLPKQEDSEPPVIVMPDPGNDNQRDDVRVKRYVGNLGGYINVEGAIICPAL